MLIVNILDLANTIVCVTKVILGMENNVNVSNILSFSIRNRSVSCKRNVQSKIFLSLTAICEHKCKNGGNCIGPNLCHCPVGYTGNSCGEDIDECLLGQGVHKCGPDSHCVNQPGW